MDHFTAAARRPVPVKSSRLQSNADAVEVVHTAVAQKWNLIAIWMKRGV